MRRTITCILEKQEEEDSKETANPKHISTGKKQALQIHEGNPPAKTPSEIERTSIELLEGEKAHFTLITGKTKPQDILEAYTNPKKTRSLTGKKSLKHGLIMFTKDGERYELPRQLNTIASEISSENPITRIYLNDGRQAAATTDNIHLARVENAYPRKNEIQKIKNNGVKVDFTLEKNRITDVYRH